MARRTPRHTWATSVTWGRWDVSDARRNATWAAQSSDGLYQGRAAAAWNHRANVKAASVTAYEIDNSTKLRRYLGVTPANPKGGR